MTKHAVTVLGLGLMGRALAGALLRAGHTTTVWNRSPGKADALPGAVVAGSVREAVAASPVVIVCVTGSAAVREVLDAAGDLDGRVVVNLSSGASREARETAARHSRYLDGAIMAAPSDIGTPASAIVYSGNRAAFDEHEHLLRDLGAATFLGDDPGLAALHETAVLGLMYGILNGFLHSAALLRAAGVPAESFVPFAGAGIETVAAWLPGYARQIDEGRYPPVDATLDTHLAAIDQVVQESVAAGVDSGPPAFARELARRAVAAGHGGDSYVSVIEQFQAPDKERS
ncbi:NAD(P)-dependent oxidoreductase [Amycolatopsis granulosa]|uniref:NAD(P)-dependent oxidoreductase n=1 Tax=Amycolatopsis granulosa TaxID=185684 RepID=UPI0014214727|nr:NAD(P)-binding domain-containing protein [Amycolatopsis granulosa]NIH84566.1 3-hydroxyisobutyrate dehydrogenase-like beta-hydroxyacid dehydrogenase [Amycolatopsis granulosa]